MTNMDAVEYSSATLKRPHVKASAKTVTIHPPPTDVMSVSLSPIPPPPPPPPASRRKLELRQINPYLTCRLCAGYLIDATTISECLHSFCRSCIIKFLQKHSHCPVCEMVVNKVKPNLKLDKTLQDIVYKLVPELYRSEMTRRRQFYQKQQPVTSLTHLTPEQRGDDTERIIFNACDKFSLRLEYLSADSTPGAILFPSHQQYAADVSMMRRFLQCPGMCPIYVLKKFVQAKYNVDASNFHIDILYKSVPLPDHYTLIDVAYIYSWKRNEPMKFLFRIIDMKSARERFDFFDAAKMATPTPVLTTTAAPKRPVTPSGRVRKRVSVKPVKTVRFQEDKDEKETKVKCESNGKPASAQNNQNHSDCASKVLGVNGVAAGSVKSRKLVAKMAADVLAYDKAKTEFFRSIDLHPRHTVHPKRKLSTSNSNSTTSLPATPTTSKVLVSEKSKRAKMSLKKQPSLPTHPPEPNLKSLLNTCKIPSSLSITCVNGGEREPQMKPVINHIEIVKLPENQGPLQSSEDTIKVRSDPKDLEKLGTTLKLHTSDDPPKKTDDTNADDAELSITITLDTGGDKSKEEKQQTNQPKPGLHPNLPKVLSNPIGVRQVTSFQKMFEDTLKKDRWKDPPPLIIPTRKEKDEKPPFKRGGSIMEIASQLYKKTKLEQEKLKQDVLIKNADGKIAIPRLKKMANSETIANLHSNTLALNYSVSVSQPGKGKMCPKEENIVTSTTRTESSVPTPPPSASPKKKSPRASDVKVTSSSMPNQPRSTSSNQKSRSRPLDANQLQEKYNLQNLAQLSASFNLPATPPQQAPASHPGMSPMVAIQQAMMLNFGMHQQNRLQTDRDKWYTFLQSFAGKSKTPPKANGQGASHLVSKEN